MLRILSFHDILFLVVKSINQIIYHYYLSFEKTKNILEKKTKAFYNYKCLFENTLFGDDGEEVTPVPIPNTEVKLFSADGS
jgi:hypothetical protein